MLPVIGGVVVAASVGYVFKYRVLRTTRNEDGESGKDVEVKLAIVDGAEEADESRNEEVAYHGAECLAGSSDVEETTSQYVNVHQSSDRSMVPCTADDFHSKLAGEKRFGDLQRGVCPVDERVVQELQNDSKQAAHSGQQGEWWEMPDLRFELHGREDKEQDAADGLRCFHQAVGNKQDDESEERVVGCVDEMPKDGWDIRLQQTGEEDEAKCKVEGSQVSKGLQETQRQALEAEHAASISKNPEKWEMLSGQEIACDKSLLEQEWEERLQQERDVANVKHKEAMEHALEAQKLELEEMWQKRLDNEQKQWEGMRVKEMEQVRRSLHLEWQDRMRREIVADRARHKVELGRHFKLAMEAQKLRLEADYAEQLEEMREKDDRKWMQKLLMEREALLAMAKTVLAQERENWRVSQEAEWRIMLAQERVQWEESEQQKDKDQNDVDACVKKETERLVDLHSATLESKEMQFHQAKEEVAQLQAELAVMHHQLEASQSRGTQSS